MKRYIINTSRYAKAVKKQIDAVRMKKCGEEYALSFSWKGGAHILARSLMPVLEAAAQYENPVYRNAPVMAKLALTLRNSCMYEGETAALTRFLQSNHCLHIEGYTRFRMSDYHEALDMLSYRLIKKMKLFAKKDWL